MIRIYTTWYSDPDPARDRELADCLLRNRALEIIDHIVLLCEGEPPEETAGDAKFAFHRIDQRPRYSDFFDLINSSATTEDISIIANTDIYFDESLATVGEHLSNRQCFALSRWDVRQDGSSELFDRNDSQDAWGFRGPIRKVKGNYPLGVPRCDNRLLYELQEAGYEVKNPAFSIRAHHFHAGYREEYSKESLSHFVDPPYRYLFPHNLLSLPHTIWHNFRHRGHRLGWRIDWRHFRSWLPVRMLRKAGRIASGRSEAGANFF